MSAHHRTTASAPSVTGTTLVVDPPPPVLLTVQHAGNTPLAFPVRRIYCVGRNDADHAREDGARPRARAAALLHQARRRDRRRRRDLQVAAKAAGRPWDLGRDFDHSAPCSAIRPAAEIGHPEGGSIRLSVNGEGRQSADLAVMIWRVPEIIASWSRFVHLAPGDLIMTGTPAGVGPVTPGDELIGAVEGVGTVRVRYDAPRGVDSEATTGHEAPG